MKEYKTIEEMTTQEKINEIQEQISQAQSELAKLRNKLKGEKQKGRWRPACGKVRKYGNYRQEQTDSGLAIGNVFKTEIEKLKVITELEEYAKPFVPGENQHALEFNHQINAISISEGHIYQQRQGCIYFESKNKAYEAVVTVGKDRIKKYLFGVEVE